MAERSLLDRMRGAAFLEIATYEEVEHDERLTSQAALVVVIVAIAGGIGGLNEGTQGLLVGIVAAVLSWLVGLIVPVWLLVAGIVAIRQALDFSTGKAILTAALGWLVAVAIPLVAGLWLFSH